jgi:hypothetical protein
MAAPSKHINAHDLYEKLKKLEYAPHNMDPQIINDLYTEVKEEAGKVIEFLKRFVQEMQE